MLLSKPKLTTQRSTRVGEGEKPFLLSLPLCQGHPEGEHGSGTDPRGERHPPEEPGHQLPAHERPRGRRGSPSPDCCHHGQGEALPMLQEQGGDLSSPLDGFIPGWNELGTSTFAFRGSQELEFLEFLWQLLFGLFHKDTSPLQNEVMRLEL